jgi:kynureninase
VTQRPATSRADAELLDGSSPLAHTRARFLLPDGVIYLDGNSLGPLPRGVPELLQQTLDDEWASGLIRSWNPVPSGDGHWM